MQQFKPPSASLLSIPSDVTLHHLMRFLSRADLLVLSLTCTAMRKIYLKWILSLEDETREKERFQSDTLDDIFRYGSIDQLVWFQQTLKYLSLVKLNEKKQILVAVKGDPLIYYIISRRRTYIDFILRRKFGTPSGATEGWLFDRRGVLQ